MSHTTLFYREEHEVLDQIRHRMKQGTDLPLWVDCLKVWQSREPLLVFLVRHSEGSGLEDLCDAVFRAGVDVDETGAGYWTPLHYACAHGKLAWVQRLMAAGAREDVWDRRGRTPRDWAADCDPSGHVESSVRDRRRAVLDWLDSLRGCGLK